jgi:hypothetical protein
MAAKVLFIDLLSERNSIVNVGYVTFDEIPFMINYDTVTEAVKGLKERGFITDFNLHENCLICHAEKFNPSEFEIVETYRFEGDSDPADEAVVYAIESKNGMKGVLVNGYGVSSDAMSDEMAKKLQVHHF